MDTGNQPLHQRDGEHFLKPIQHMLAGFANFDPAVEKKLAVGPDVPKFAVEWAHRRQTSPQQQAVGDLIIVAFYYLLRIGEYTTKGKRTKQTRTRQFRVQDVTFFRRDKTGFLLALPPSASDDSILNADAATLRISNQKNGNLGACVHHEAIAEENIACHVKALGRRVQHIRKYTKNPNTLLGTYWDEVGRGSVTDGMIRIMLKFAANSLGYPARGIPLRRVDTHSLRSGGACALAQAGYSDRAIEKMGRWSPNSQSFKEYIQQQLSTFSQGMSKRMSEVPRFTNMEGTGKATNLRHTTVH